MTNIERLIIEILAGVALAGGLILYFEHRGAQACLKADAAAAQKQETHNEVKAALDAQTINQEAKTYAQAVAVAPDPTPALVCVRKYQTRPLSETATARPRNDGPTDLPKADSPGFDPGPRLTPIGREADARVAYLQNYIAQVCLTR